MIPFVAPIHNGRLLNTRERGNLEVISLSLKLQWNRPGQVGRVCRSCQMRAESSSEFKSELVRLISEENIKRVLCWQRDECSRAAQQLPQNISQQSALINSSVVCWTLLIKSGHFEFAWNPNLDLIKETFLSWTVSFWEMLRSCWKTRYRRLWLENWGSQVLAGVVYVNENFEQPSVIEI